MLTDFHENLITGIFYEMIQMRGSDAMLTSKLHILLNILALFDKFSWDFYSRDSFDETVKMKGNSLMLTPKLHVLLNILPPCWQILMGLL